MKKLFIIFAVAFTIAPVAKSQNILLKKDNKPVDYAAVNAAMVKEAVDKTVRECDIKINAIIKSVGRQTMANTFHVLDELGYELADIGSKLQLISSTYADDDTRDAAFQASGSLQLYSSNIYLNEALYKAVKKFSVSKAASLSATQKKFLNDAIIVFEKNGMKLDAAGREKLKSLNTKLVELGNQFDRNISESKDSLTFNKESIKGVPAPVSDAWKRGDDKYVVYVNGPNHTNIAENADDWYTRKAMYTAYNNRAYPKNIDVLDSLLYYRNEFANLLGYKSYAAYSVADKMAASPANVWAFENDLIKKLSTLVSDEVKAMKTFKQHLFPGAADTVYAWDFAYCNKKMLNENYQLNVDEVKEYFEMNNTLTGMFTVYQKLLNIEIKEAPGRPVWNNKVRTFEMWKDGKKAGDFYLDLYPRPNKYTHFACFPMDQYRLAQGKEILPTASLVCNFPEGNAEQPSLLKHSEVITLFHEFGHLVHWLLCHPAITSQNAFSIKGDFIEAPSQFLENWCWEYDALKLFAKNYKTGQPLPLSLFNKMKAAQLMNAGSFNMRQVYLGVTDFTFEDKYEETKAKGLMQVSKEVFELGQIPFPEGSHFICSFTHLNGYAANYYGYLWSKVYAQDMFSIFKKKGVMDKATGIRYRKKILETGSSIPEIKAVENFLGRKSNSDAFMESLGIKK